MFAPYFTISPDAIRYGHAQGTNGAQFWPYTIMLINDKVAPPTIAGTIFGINNEMNTNGENVKNNKTFANRSWLKLVIISFKVNPSRPAIKPNISVDKLVTAVNITIHTKNIMYLDIKNFFLDIGIVSIVFNVCSLYSLPNR